MWSFECVDNNNKTHLHLENWHTFIIERYDEYPHNWNHRRCLLSLITPRRAWLDLPGINEDNPILSCVEKDFSVIFQPYPSHQRHGLDSNCQNSSLHVIAEDGHVNPLGEMITLFATENGFFSREKNKKRYAKFLGFYWRVLEVKGGGFGIIEPPVPPVVSKSKFRCLDDEWNS